MAAPRKVERERLAKTGKAETRSEPGAGVGSYPTNTKGRAVAAKGRATQAVKAGRISTATERGIDRRADVELGKSKQKRK